jgi:LPXTG-motif cell wall-anchored protein
LPLTGSDTPLYVGSGVLVLVLGRFLMVVTKRRRTVA